MKYESVANMLERGVIEVLIYDSGTVVLKVEVGTTLEVMKLLYEAEKNHSSEKIIGVRPRQVNGIPCIVTLQDSKLEEASYEVIFKDNRLKLVKSERNHNEQQQTTRCIDCSQETWKSKRYTSVGMNTEISINPLSEVDTSRSQLIPYNSSKQSNNIDSQYLIRPRACPTIQRPVPISPAVYCSTQKNDYLMTTLPSLSESNCVPIASDYMNYRPHSPKTSPVYGTGHTKICYPPKAKIVDLDAIMYQNAMRRRAVRTDSPPYHINRSANISPPRRSRSPHEKQRISYKMEDRRSLYENNRVPAARNEHYPHYEQRVPSLVVAAVPTQQAEQTSEGEPPVFVLPNDFDSKHDIIEDHVISYRATKDYLKDVPEVKQEIEQTDRSSPTTSVGSDSSKSIEEQQQPLVRKLSCKICQKTFPTKSTLYKHLRGHSSDEKPFKCDECGQGFTLSSNLRQHRIIHRGYKPFQCEYCGKKFMRSNVYKQHRRIHTGEQMHKCNLCPSEFLQRYALVKHVKKMHNVDTAIEA